MAPRFGFTYLLTGDGKTVLKANWGKYWDNPGTGAGNPNGEWQKRHAWNDTNGDLLWQPGEEGRLVSSSGGVETVANDPNQKDQYAINVAAWLERELVANLSVRGGFVRRKMDQLIATINTNQPYDAFTIPVTITDPGPDGSRGTADDGGSIAALNLQSACVGLPTKSFVTNVPGTSKYDTWEIAVTKRMSVRWSATTGFSHTTSRAYRVPSSSSPYNPNSHRADLVLACRQTDGTHRIPSLELSANLPEFRHYSPPCETGCAETPSML